MLSKQIETFFAEVFDAKSAKMILADKEEYKILNIIEIDTGDERGVIHIGHLTKDGDIEPRGLQENNGEKFFFEAKRKDAIRRFKTKDNK